jgi:hypothetical protein
MIAVDWSTIKNPRFNDQISRKDQGSNSKVDLLCALEFEI